jgi:hypothetical protein
MTLRGAFSAKSAHPFGRLRKLWISGASLLASLEARRSRSMTRGDSTLSIRENYAESVSDGVKAGVLHIGNAGRYQYCGAYATHHTLELTSPGKFLSTLIQPSARALLTLDVTAARRCTGRMVSDASIVLRASLPLPSRGRPSAASLPESSTAPSRDFHAFAA